MWRSSCSAAGRWGVGRGNEIYPLPDAPRRHLLVVSSREISVPTREAYAWLGRGLTKPPAASRLMKFCALAGARREEASLERFRGVAVFRRHTRLGRIQAGIASATEPQMPRWRVAGRRCSESSETQRRRAEPPIGFRTTRYSSCFHCFGVEGPPRPGAAWGGRVRHRLMDDKFKIFCGSANVPLADGNLPSRRECNAARGCGGSVFSDGETHFQSRERSRRGRFCGAALLAIRRTST